MTVLFKNTAVTEKQLVAALVKGANQKVRLIVSEIEPRKIIWVAEFNISDFLIANGTKVSKKLLNALPPEFSSAEVEVSVETVSPNRYLGG